MALLLIGAGFGRTGTMSMKAALETLELGPCHHMVEVNNKPDQRDIWRAIAAGKSQDWDTAFAGYKSAVDWPSAFFWRELSQYYPQAKILLTVRTAESWYTSMTNTIFPSIATSADTDGVAVKLIRERVFGDVLDDKAHAIAIFEQNVAEVQASFDDERLLTYSVGDGWEPLCRFLGTAVPDIPFPSSNSTEEFKSRNSK